MQQVQSTHPVFHPTDWQSVDWHSEAASPNQQPVLHSLGFVDTKRSMLLTVLLLRGILTIDVCALQQSKASQT